MMVSEIIEIPTPVSLGVVLGILGFVLALSFVRARKHPA
jgi:tellurite resistance protein TerC